jgi:pseudouridine synthase
MRERDKRNPRRPRGGRSGGRRHPTRQGPDRRGGRGPRTGPALESEPIRLQAYLARAGVASRRASEQLIVEGRVTVNHQTVTELGTKVIPGRDEVAVDGRVVERQKSFWIALNKPKGYVTTRSDERDRRTVYDLLPREHHHLFHVGRLDRDSEGLLLLTNEGEVANRLMHPRYGVLKEYLADVAEPPTDETLEQLVTGVELEDGTAHAIEAEYMGILAEDRFRVRVVLEEGRNREVRRLLEALGHPVLRLRRRSFGPIKLGNLAPGRWRALTPDEVRELRAIGRDHPSP